jgi:hypothetical protein
MNLTLKLNSNSSSDNEFAFVALSDTFNGFIDMK